MHLCSIRRGLFINLCICVAYVRKAVVRVNWKQQGKYFDGKVEKVEINAGVNSTYTIKYDDGSIESGVRHDNIIG